MKGLVIIATVLLGFVGGLYLLLRPSDMDLVRIEEDVAQLLDQGSESLAQITLVINALRSIRPNVQALDQELNGLRQQLDQLHRDFRALPEDRPSGNQDHAPFLRKRKQLRTRSEEVREQALGLLERVKLVNDYMHETQPQVQVMKEAFRKLFTLRRQLEQDGQTIEPALSQKIDYLYAEKESLLALARNVIATGSQNAAEGRTIASAVAGGVTRIIADAEALTRQLAAQ